MTDWKRIRAEYDQTTIDWNRLNAYAKRVASELTAKSPSASEFYLMSRYWKREDKYEGRTETHRNTTDYMLKGDGSLVVRSISWEEHLGDGYWETPKQTHESLFNDSSVMMFDFERKYYRARGVETDRDRSEKLIVHAKGVGLSKCLKQLLE